MFIAYRRVVLLLGVNEFHLLRRDAFTHQTRSQCESVSRPAVITLHWIVECVHDINGVKCTDTVEKEECSAFSLSVPQGRLGSTD